MLMIGKQGRPWHRSLRWPTRLLTVMLAMESLGADDAARIASERGLSYTNYRIASVPWSLHVVRIRRNDPTFEFHSVHANAGALGLSTLTNQIQQLSPRLGTPVAAINGDFYQRTRSFIGDPRGPQIVDAEVISAPSGGVAFWIDGFGRPHLTNVYPRFEVLWPSGLSTPFGLNGERGDTNVQVYTPALGSSTLTMGGLEFILERSGESPWLPLRMAETYTARVREVRAGGNAPLAPGTMVLSPGTNVLRTIPEIKTGAVVKLATDSSPTLWASKVALGGGPILVRGGKAQQVLPPPVESYEFTSMQERHPRSALGWNRDFFLLVQVDGRQERLSVGMELKELAAYLVKLGCEEAMNLDGGGSSTLWFEGQVRNKPCDGVRPIANALVVVRTASMQQPQSGPAPSQQ